MLFGWYEPEATGFRLLLLRVGTGAALLGMVCLMIVAAIALIGMFAA